jgi:hypothetical protein
LMKIRSEMQHPFSDSIEHSNVFTFQWEDASILMEQTYNATSRYLSKLFPSVSKIPESSDKQLNVVETNTMLYSMYRLWHILYFKNRKLG